MTTIKRRPARCKPFLALILSAAAALTACSDSSENGAAEGAAAQARQASDYNELIAALPALAPKSEVETSVEFAARKQQRLASLAALQLRVSIPVTLGKCKAPESSETAGAREFIGLRYNADNEQLEVCAFDTSALEARVDGRSYGMLITDSASTSEQSVRSNLMGAKLEVTERTTTGKAIFVDLPTHKVLDFARATIPFKLAAAKDMLANGARLVYDVVLDPDGSTDLLTSSTQTRPTMMNPESVGETFVGVAAKVRSIALESSTGALIGRFEIDAENHYRPGLSLVPDPDSLAGAGEGTKTRYGVLRFGSGGAYLEGKKVFERGDGGDMQVAALRPLGMNDIVVATESSGGSAGYITVVLFDIAPGQKVTALRADADALRNFDSKAIRQSGNTLVLDLGFAAGKHRMARFNGKTLTTTLEESGPVALPEALCKQVQDVIGACAARHREGGDCEDTFDNLSNAEKGGIYDTFAYPGLIEERFKKACDTACTAGSAPNFSETRTALCAPAT